MIASYKNVFCAQYINIGTGGADLGSSYFLWRLVGWGRAAEMCMTGDRVPAAVGVATNMVSKNKLGLRFTKDAFNAALNASSLEDANSMENRNQAFVILSGLPEREKSE